MIGTVLGHYRLVEELGAGGMGVVYRARDERLERDVAIKVLPEGILDETARARFRREALALSRLSHPHIGTIHDFGSDGGTDYLVMEMVRGRTLRDRLRGGVLSLEEAVDVASAVAEALEEAHEQGVIHRDLKPENVLITPKGWVKVLDFGLASLRSSSSATVMTETLTAANMLTGTLPYMSPEQLLGKPAEPRTDLYALGILLYELATGSRPFEAGVQAALIGEILHRDPVPPSSRRPGLPAWFDEIVARCLAKDPDGRFPNAGALKEALASGTRGGRAAAAAVSAVGDIAPAVPSHAAERGGSGSVAAPARISSLAVLPLENLSGDPEQEFFADGITEDLISALARATGSRVISRTSAMRYKGTRKSLPEVARELGVDAVVEGTVRRVGDRIRINAQLIEAAADRQLWSKGYESDARDVLGLQARVAEAIAAEVRSHLESRSFPVGGPPTSGVVSPPAATPPSGIPVGAGDRPVNPEAYDAVLRGRQIIGRRTEESMRRGVEYLRRAIEIDPLYPPAYAGLATAYDLMGFFAMTAPVECFPRARVSAAKAVELDPMSAPGHIALAYVSLYYDWDPASSEELFRRGIELDPQYPTGHLWYANLLIFQKRFEEGAEAINRAQALDPLASIVTMSHGWTAYFQGDYETALREYKRATDFDPEFHVAHWMSSWVLMQAGRHDEAEAAVRRAIESSRGLLICFPSLARAHALAGRPEEARRILADLEAKAPARYVEPLEIALAYEALGNRETALAWMDRGLRERAHWLVAVNVDPRFDSLRNDPRFVMVMEQVTRGSGAAPSGG